jgi:hypothetical protein
MNFTDDVILQKNIIPEMGNTIRTDLPEIMREEEDRFIGFHFLATGVIISFSRRTLLHEVRLG